MIADGVSEAQVQRHGDDARAEGRSLLQAVRDGCQCRAAAALAVPGVALHARHHGADTRQLDLVVAAVEVMVRLAQDPAAVPASGRLGAHDLIGLRHQAAAAALAAQASFARAGWLRRVRAVRLLPLGRRHTGVVRRLRGIAQPLLQGREPRRQRHDLLPKRDDQRVLLRVAQRRQIGQRRNNHSKVESRSGRPVKPSPQPPFRTRSRHPGPSGMSSYPIRSRTFRFLPFISK